MISIEQNRKHRPSSTNMLILVRVSITHLYKITIQYVTSDNTLSIRNKTKLKHYLRICPKTNTDLPQLTIELHLD